MSLPEPPKLPPIPELPTPELPAAPELPRPPWEQEPTLIPKTPGIAGGVVTAPGKGWQLVEYADISNGAKIRFSVKPIVLALAEVRFGDIPLVQAPKIQIPPIELPRASAIFRIPRDDFNSDYYCKRVAQKAADRVHELDLGFVLNPVKAIIADKLIYWSFYAAMYAIGFIFNVLWDSFFQPQIDRVGGDIDAVIASLRTKTQDAVNLIGAEIQTRVNQGLSAVIPVLYAMMGFGPRQLITPVNTQKVTTTSFEYYALTEGQKTHYIALGVP